MKYTSLIAACILGCAAAKQPAANDPAHHPDHSSQQAAAALMPGLGTHHHPVSTSNADAQRFFDQGMSLIFAFNHEEAVRSFRKAAELDPQLAMAWWGAALALGPNINLDVDPAREKAAYEAAQKALAMSAKAPPQERAYIEAVAKRYSIDPKADLKKLAVEYKNAMGELMRRYPDDLDAATLYAESGMDLRPWELWTADGKPQEGTEEIVAVLESVLKRDPNHIGANHYYIHAVEASVHPERALPSAERLKTLAPSAGHLVHMPAHIYIRTGDYEQASKRNEVAAAVDEEYIKSSGAHGFYPMMYYSHNLHFLAVARAEEGRFAEAKTAADRLASHVGPHLKDMPMLEGFMPTPTLVLVRFGRWDDILKLPQPSGGTAMSAAIWHFARGMAYAASGRPQDAAQEQKAFVTARDQLPADAIYSPRNKASDVLAVAGGLLNGKIAAASGDKRAAIDQLRKTAEAEDRLNYMEPRDWYIPVREALGGVLMADGDYAAAEQVFRDQLERSPRSGRPLYGLMESLRAQGKTYEAETVRPQFDNAWKNADAQLKMHDL